MDFYINILIKPDAEMRENVLLNKVYTKLHKALFGLKADNIGVSFPQYKVRLGRVIRVHGSKQSLQHLQKDNWIGGLAGYCAISAPEPVPEGVPHRTVSRIECNMTQSKMRRLIKRGSLKPEEVKNYKAKLFTQGLDNPYLELESGSNGHRYRRFIAFGEEVSAPISGSFDVFGLSKQATVPWF